MKRWWITLLVSLYINPVFADRGFVITESPLIVVTESKTEPAKSSVSASDSDEYIVLFTASYCGPCRTWKKNELPKLHAIGRDVRQINIQTNTQYGISVVPTFVIYSRTTRKELRRYVGYTSADVLMSRAVHAVRAVNRSTVQRTTQREIEAAAHLRSVHGIDPAGMTLQEMEAAHDRAHGFNARFPSKSPARPTARSYRSAPIIRWFR